MCRMVEKRVKNDDHQGYDIGPVKHLHIFPFPEHQDGQKKERYHKPETRNQEFDGNNGNLAGECGYKHPDKVDNYGNGYRMPYNTPVVASIKDQFQNE